MGLIGNVRAPSEPQCEKPKKQCNDYTYNTNPYLHQADLPVTNGDVALARSQPAPARGQAGAWVELAAEDGTFHFFIGRTGRARLGRVPATVIRRQLPIEAIGCNVKP